MTNPVRGKAHKGGAASPTPSPGAAVMRTSDAHGGAWLTEVLDSEYARYEPDTRHIRTLLEERLEDDGVPRGAGGRVRAPLLGLRLAGIPAGIAAAALCATVAVAVTATVASNQPHTAPRAARNHGGLPAVGGLPSDASSPSSAAGAPGPGTHSAVSGPGTQTATKPAGPPERQSPPAASATPPDSGPSPVSAVGAIAPSSNAQWTEEDVHITLQDPVTALQLIIHVTPNAGYSKEHFWSDHDIAAFDVSVNPNAGGLIYTFNLKPGNTIQAGLFTIAAQYQHDSSPHDTSGDTYSLNVTTDQAHGSAQGSARGGF